MADSELSPYVDIETGSFLEKKNKLLRSFGTPIRALLYADLFSPNLVEVDGSVILSDNVADAAETFRTRKSDSELSLEEFEASFNLVEIAYLFTPGSETNDAVETELAQIIATCWQGKLKLLYPDRTFCVSVLSPPETGSVVAVEFYEVR